MCTAKQQTLNTNVSSKPFSVVVAIDFRRTYSSYAYAYYHPTSNDKPNIIATDWPSKFAVSPKNASAILFRQTSNSSSLEVVDYGFAAENKYIEACISKTADDLHLVINFKMELYNKVRE